MRIALIISFFLLSYSVKSQDQFADKSFYLIDSLVLDNLTQSDRTLIDSTLKLYHEASHDTIKLNYLSHIVEESWDEAVWPKYNQLMYKKVRELLSSGLPAGQAGPPTSLEKKYLFFLAEALNNIGYIYDDQGDIPKALEYYHKSLKIEEEIGNKQGIANSLNNIGVIYKNQGDIPKALEYYHKSLKIFEETGYKQGIAISLNNIGYIYDDQGDIPKALEYYHKSLKIEEEIGNKAGIATSLSNIGIIYNQQGDMPKALKYHHKSLKIEEEMGNKTGIAISLSNIGIIYEDQGDILKALEYYHKSLKIEEEIGNKAGIASSLYNIGDIELVQEALARALKNGTEGLLIAREIGSPDLISANSGLLSKVAKKQGNYKEALEMYELHIQMRDSIKNEETQKATIRQQARYEYEKQHLADSLEFAKEQEVKDLKISKQQAQLKQSRTQKIAIAGGGVLFLVLSIVAFKSYRTKRRDNIVISAQKEEVEKQKLEVEQQKELVEEKNKDITDSIRYAQNIQKAILRPIEEIKKTLPESFILFKPKDIVSGDFYFFSKVNQYTIIAACDCTGHGVPGAFMSMIGNSLLNEVVNDKSVTDAAEVLNQLRDGIIRAFGEAGATGEQKDGMDMALCAFQQDKDNGIVNLQYAGANNPLYLIREGELQQVKADKQPVGYHFGEQKPFTNHNIPLRKGDTIYLFSDGYQDQFGGPRGKKFMSKRFRQLLLDIQEMSMEKQKEQLNKTIEDWKGNGEQVDDILVIGVRV